MWIKKYVHEHAFQLLAFALKMPSEDLSLIALLFFWEPSLFLFPALSEAARFELFVT